MVNMIWEWLGTVGIIVIGAFISFAPNHPQNNISRFLFFGVPIAVFVLSYYLWATTGRGLVETGICKLSPESFSCRPTEPVLPSSQTENDNGSAHGEPVESKPPTAKILFYKDWRLSCSGSGSSPVTGCNLSADINDEETHATLAKIRIGHSVDEEHALEMVVTVPLTVLIEPGVTIKVESTAVTARYQTCVPEGCVATIPMDASLKSALDASTAATFTVTAENGTAVDLRLPLDGYNAARKAFTAEEINRHVADAWSKL
jgi:invasion protein IalB